MKSLAVTFCLSVYLLLPAGYAGIIPPISQTVQLQQIITALQAVNGNLDSLRKQIASLAKQQQTQQNDHNQFEEYRALDSRYGDPQNSNFILGISKLSTITMTSAENYASQQYAYENTQKDSSGKKTLYQSNPDGFYKFVLNMMAGNFYTGNSEQNSEGLVTINDPQDETRGLELSAAFTLLNQNSESDRALLKAIQDQAKQDWVVRESTASQAELLRQLSLQLHINNALLYKNYALNKLNTELKLFALYKKVVTTQNS